MTLNYYWVTVYRHETSRADKTLNSNTLAPISIISFKFLLGLSSKKWRKGQGYGWLQGTRDKVFYSVRVSLSLNNIVSSEVAAKHCL